MNRGALLLIMIGLAFALTRQKSTGGGFFSPQGTNPLTGGWINPTDLSTLTAGWRQQLGQFTA